MRLINTCQFEDAEKYLHNCKRPSYWVNSRSGNGLTVLNIAILRKAPMGIVSLLVEKGGNKLLLSQDNRGGSILHNIISTYNKSIHDFEQRHENGDQEAEEEEDEEGWQYVDEVFQYLLESGGYDLVMLKDCYGDTALSYLLKSGSQPIQACTWGMAMVGIGGRDLCLSKDENGYNSMHHAVYRCNYSSLFDVLLAAGGKDLVLDENRRGYTPLHYLFYIQQDSSDKEKIPTNILRAMMMNGGADYLITFPDCEGFARREILWWYVYFSFGTFHDFHEYPRVIDVLENIQIMSDVIIQTQPGTLGQLLEIIDVHTILQKAINLGIYDSHKESSPSEKVKHWRMILSFVESKLFQDVCYTFDVGTNTYPILSLAKSINRYNKDLLSILYYIIRSNPSHLLNITMYYVD